MLTLEEILQASSGVALNDSAPTGFISEFVFDSRKVSPQSVFVCIKGERIDSHDLVAEAVQRGAAVILGDNQTKLEALAKLVKNAILVQVSSTLTATQKIAAYYRGKFQIPVIGLTGSTGKTTTKDLLRSILNPHPQYLVTEGSLNNHWGVPQTVLKLRAHHRGAVFELGTSGFGEIRDLCDICQPTVGAITKIGASHLEMLKNEEGVLRAKRELLDWMVSHQDKSTFCFNINDARLQKLYREAITKQGSRLHAVPYALQKTEGIRTFVERAEPIVTPHFFGWKYTFSTTHGHISGELPLPGMHNLENALCATALALESGLASTEQVEDGLRRPVLSKFRSAIFRARGGATVYDDTYNANPTSVAALFEAAHALVQAQPQLRRTIAVVGDMLELGSDAHLLHEAAGKQAAQSGVTHLLAIGQFSDSWVQGFRADQSAHAAAAGSGTDAGTNPKAAPGIASRVASRFDSKSALVAELQILMQEDPNHTLVLVKGSRGAKMEEVVEKMR